MRTPAWSFNPRVSIASRPARLLAATTTAIVAAVGVAGCVVYETPRPHQTVYVEQPPPAPPPAEPAPPPEPVYDEPAPQPVVSVYVEPPLAQPAPIAVGWAPPPMLVEAPPPMPFGGAVWIGGYWVWQGNWVWAAGRWAPPPQPGYVWAQPYYEHRDGAVIFITGHWHARGVVFVPPPPTLRLTVVAAAPGVIPGHRPVGPVGVFVPAPPGSRVGLIVPAPVGTPPAVVASAPPLVGQGMRIRPTTINNTQVTNVTNVTNVTIVAPPGATAGGRAYESAVPAQAHLAAAMPPKVNLRAPVPASARPIPAYVPGRAQPALPPAQIVRPVARSTPPQPAATAQTPATPVAPVVGAPPRETPVAATNPAAPATTPQQAAVPAPGNGRHPPGRDRVPAVTQEPARAQPDVPHVTPVATAPATAPAQAVSQKIPPGRDDGRVHDAGVHRGNEAKTAKAEQPKNGGGNAEQAKAEKEEKRKKGEKERE